MNVLHIEQKKQPENVRAFRRPERTVISQGGPSKPPEVARVGKHMNQMIIGGIFAMMMYGLLLPTDWQERFGVLAQPIIWAAETVPSIVKMAHVAAIPELIQGFYGLGVYVVPLFGLAAYIYCGYIHLSIRYSFAISNRPFWKTFCLLYLLGFPFIFFFIWMYYIHPPSGGFPSGVTWGSKIFLETIENRLSLSFFGSCVTVGIGMFVCFFIHLVVGPVILLVNTIKGDDKCRH